MMLTNKKNLSGFLFLLSLIVHKNVFAAAPCDQQFEGALSHAASWTNRRLQDGLINVSEAVAALQASVKYVNDRQASARLLSKDPNFVYHEWAKYNMWRDCMRNQALLDGSPVSGDTSVIQKLAAGQIHINDAIAQLQNSAEAAGSTKQPHPLDVLSKVESFTKEAKVFTENALKHLDSVAPVANSTQQSSLSMLDVISQHLSTYGVWYGIAISSLLAIKYGPRIWRGLYNRFCLKCKRAQS